MSHLKRYKNFESLKTDANPVDTKDKARRALACKNVFAALSMHKIVQKNSKEKIVKANGI